MVSMSWCHIYHALFKLFMTIYTHRIQYSLYINSDAISLLDRPSDVYNTIVRLEQAGKGPSVT